DGPRWRARLPGGRRQRRRRQPDERKHHPRGRRQPRPGVAARGHRGRSAGHGPATAHAYHALWRRARGAPSRGPARRRPRAGGERQGRQDAAQQAPEPGRGRLSVHDAPVSLQPPAAVRNRASGGGIRAAEFMKIVITGANSSVGKSLLSHIAGAPDLDAVALVRGDLAALPGAANIQAVKADYGDVNGLARALEGADCVVHLAGILIESRTSRYQEANVDVSAAIARAARQADAGRLIFVSVIGADPASRNPYHRSKGEAERLQIGRA